MLEVSIYITNLLLIFLIFFFIVDSKDSCQGKKNAINFEIYFTFQLLITDIFLGDSGSSIQNPEILTENSAPQCIQYGIVSYGDKICGSSKPGVYTKVYPYLRWILSSIN